MMEKLKQHVMQMKVKKTVLTFVITAIILIAGFSVALYSNFGSRVRTWENDSKQAEEYAIEEDATDEDPGALDERDISGQERDQPRSKGHSGKNDRAKNGNTNSGRSKSDQDSSDRAAVHDPENDIKSSLTTGDKALLIAAGIAGVVIVIWYWILVMMWAYRKAVRLGLSGAAWVWITLFFNLIAILVLYLYGMFRGTCSNCGKIRKKGQNYCDRCGMRFEQPCPNCGHMNPVNASFCTNCGADLNADSYTSGQSTETNFTDSTTEESDSTTSKQEMSADETDTGLNGTSDENKANNENTEDEAENHEDAAGNTETTPDENE